MRVGPTLDKILEQYPNDVAIALKQHPLAMHSQAMLAAESALAAHAQGKFEAMHRKLLQHSRELSRERILAIAGEIGLDIERFSRDLETHAHKAEIDRDTKEAVTVGATGTPASFINGRYLSGAQPFESFKKLIDEELGKVRAGD